MARKKATTALSPLTSHENPGAAFDSALRQSSAEDSITRPGKEVMRLRSARLRFREARASAGHRPLAKLGGSHKKSGGSRREGPGSGRLHHRVGGNLRVPGQILNLKAQNRQGPHLERALDMRLGNLVLGQQELQPPVLCPTCQEKEARRSSGADPSEPSKPRACGAAVLQSRSCYILANHSPTPLQKQQNCPFPASMCPQSSRVT